MQSKRNIITARGARPKQIYLTYQVSKREVKTMRKLTALEKDFQQIISKAISDNTPLSEKDRERFDTQSIKRFDTQIPTYGALNKTIALLYDRGMLTFREAINMIAENMTAAENEIALKAE